MEIYQCNSPYKQAERKKKNPEEHRIDAPEIMTELCPSKPFQS